MSESSQARARAIETGLLRLSRDAATLAWTLERLVPAPELAGLLRRGGTPPAAQPALALARLLAARPQVAADLAQLILASAPVASAADLASAKENPDAVTAEGWRAVLLEALESGAERGPATLATLRESLGDQLPPPPSAAAPGSPAPKRAAKPARGRTRGARGANDSAAAATPAAAAPDPRLRAELTALQGELAREHERRRALAEELEQARAEAREERLRATEMKKRLAAATGASERERTLAEAAALAQRELAVTQQKFRLIEEERDDLRACLEDHDRFLAVPEEEVPSFRNRPLLPEEVELGQRLIGGPAFRVLVVGGGEPQHRHRAKLDEYAEAVGFRAEWRMAEYVSWHRELDKLRADMRQHFDAMVILHWNRTTFTRHARTICDEAGHKPCITCRYEGFTSLRTTLRECLRQLVERRAAAAG